ncbi:hypothetical protein [Salibacterium lacus]|uniref:Uncharacterized protein n=1 Tax=Salibacterium lacus TaxID=1898109 RepID=A0ABW5SWT5_9BACI
MNDYMYHGFPAKVMSGDKLRTEAAGNRLEEQLTEADANSGTLTFAEEIESIEIYNTDDTNDGIFTVNGIDITVPAGKTYQSRVGGSPSDTVTVSGATTYIVSRYE